MQGETIINQNGITIKNKPKCTKEVATLSVLPINLSPDDIEINIAPDVPQIYGLKNKTIIPNYKPVKKDGLHCRLEDQPIPRWSCGADRYFKVTPIILLLMLTNALSVLGAYQSLDTRCGRSRQCIFQRTIDKYSACVEVGTTHKHLRRGDNSNNFKNYFSSNDITCEEVKSVDSQRFSSLDTSYVRATREPEKKKKETATHIGIREAEDWFRPIDLAKECDIYISSRSGSHKEIPITYGYTQDPFKNRSQNFKPKVKENYPQYLERENKNCFICGDSSHCARDCEKRFKPKESNDRIHNRINVNTLKIESEKQNSDECANLQYVNIFVENQPVTALIDSGCQSPVLNSSLIRVQTPSEEIIALSSCFGEQRMVEVKPINISLNQHSPSLSVRTAISHRP
ncbi:hypothetical protein TNCV_720881 [Trichonephila clavipes]|nr:hypothetical protein TNCV_720881 [Trichonephila clavipes]